MFETAKGPTEPTRVYLKTSPSEYARLFWCHNYKPNEMLLGLNGLRGETPTLRYEFPEYVLSGAELANVQYKYSDAKKLDVPIDHFSCHVDGTST